MYFSLFRPSNEPTTKAANTQHSMRLATGSWSVFQPATSRVCVCVCACTLIRPQDVNCNIHAHAHITTILVPLKTTPSGARCAPSLWESDETLGTCEPPGSGIYFVASPQSSYGATSHQRPCYPSHPPPPSSTASIIPLSIIPIPIPRARENKFKQ